MEVQERFFRYIALDTTSNEACPDCPSSERQWALAKLLKEEMEALGLSDVRLDEHCYLYGFIPGNEPAAPAIGLIAHMDTVDAVPGSPINARILRYEGGDVVLNKEKGIVMKEADFSSLSRHIGKDLIVTDGTTLLGADDKAGVAEIMTLCEYILTHPEVKHGKICVGFTPDEEIGRGADLFDSLLGHPVMQGITLSNVIAFENGFVALSAPDDFGGWVFPEATCPLCYKWGYSYSILIASYWSWGCAQYGNTNSYMRVGTLVDGTTVVEFHDMKSGRWSSDGMTCQVIIPGGTGNVVRVSYLSSDVLLDGRSASGSSIQAGVQNARRALPGGKVYSLEWNSIPSRRALRILFFALPG